MFFIKRGNVAATFPLFLWCLWDANIFNKGEAMKTITINVAENGAAICSDTELGRAGEHNNTSLHIVITDPAMLGCETFRIWLGNRYSARLTATEGQIEYTLPQEALIPPCVDFQLCGYKIIEGEPCLITRSSVITFSVSESAGCVMMSQGAYEPYEMISIECGASALAAQSAMQKAEQYCEAADMHYKDSVKNAERIEKAVGEIGDAPERAAAAVQSCEQAASSAQDSASRAEAAAEYLESALGDIDASLDGIIEIQNLLIGGNG